MIEREVIVVGGGPGGAAAATALTETGLDCLVLDREPFPRDKLCAGWITPEVMQALGFTPSEYPHRLLTFERLNVSLWPFHGSIATTQHSIRRYEFDNWLLARSGADVAVHKVRGIRPDSSGFVIDGLYRCRYVIGAGGTRCPVYRCLFHTSAPRPRALQVVALELEFPYEWTNPDCHLWFLTDNLPGYSWYVPKADGYLNIGVGGMATGLKRRPSDIRYHWDKLIERLLGAGLIDLQPGPPRGYSYYLHAAPTVPRKGNALLVGDAAGFATRDLCEGIGPAVQSAQAAVEIIRDPAQADVAGIDAFTIRSRLIRRALERRYLTSGTECRPFAALRRC